MTIKLYNTKTRAKEVFTPIDADNVRMYVCGPTVYDRAHLGNARPVVVFDVLYRLLRHTYGAKHVTYVRNFTDVDDKINARAAESGRAIGEITAETTQWFLDDMGAIGALEPDAMPRATQYIDQMIALAQDLIVKGHAYEAEGHVLFAVESYADYGKLSGRSIDDMIAGARVEVAPYKRNPMDFVLWKPSDADTPGWDSPWGRGRPGWHIECSAMANELLGPHFDIHGGGSDLMFPHHENEIAQSKCAGHDFANVWMHNEMLQVEGKKMSKSLGNFFTVRDLLDQGVPGEVIRMVFLGTHYGKPMDWTEKKRAEAEKNMALLTRALEIAEAHGGTATGDLKDLVGQIAWSLCDDLNTSGAISALMNEAKVIVGYASGTRSQDNKAASDVIREHANGFLTALDVLGLLSLLKARATEVAAAKTGLSAFEQLLSDVRTTAMKTKDFSSVDALKSALVEAGVEVRMSKAGVELIPGPNFDAAKLEQIQ